MKKFINTITTLFRVPDLRKRVLIVLGYLLIFRIIANIPLPDVDLNRIQNLLSSNQLFGILNVFIGNTLSRLSIAMLGVGPYITAVIIMQLLTMVYPRLKEMYYEEGDAGKLKFNQYGRYLTVPLALLQSFGFLKFLEAQGVIFFASPFDLIRDVILVTTGTIFLMWLGELITEQKLSNGISLIIFSGIVAQAPQIIQQALVSFTLSSLNGYIIFGLMAILVVAGIIFISEGERRIPLSFAKRVRGTKLYGGASSYLPIRVNQAGVIPIIFAISLLLFPATISQILATTNLSFIKPISVVINNILKNNFVFASLYFILVFAFTYFYTAITFEPHELSLNFQKSGAFILGIRPGQETTKYLSQIVSRLTLFGAFFLGLIAILPQITQAVTGLEFAQIGGTSILIVVAVAIESIRQIESELAARRYEV
ncbi:MAG: preprotein translocase subunit SecY [Patescibacteria group bacterium]|nr:preprotein translocase subunit SecY [Patescibacteria group bacterium]MCL5257918.1 preprotein translocase subunit SecY [Patescibacteria group bacterium]